MLDRARWPCQRAARPARPGRSVRVSARGRPGPVPGDGRTTVRQGHGPASRRRCTWPPGAVRCARSPAGAVHRAGVRPRSRPASRDRVVRHLPPSEGIGARCRHHRGRSAMVVRRVASTPMPTSSCAMQRVSSTSVGPRGPLDEIAELCRQACAEHDLLAWVAAARDREGSAS